MKEKNYNKFNHPDLDVDEVFYCLSLLDDYEGFRVILRSESFKKVIKIEFDSYVAYRNAYADDRIRLFTKIKSDNPKSTMYQVSDSEWIDWFVAESMGTYSTDEIKHYVIITREFVIESLSLEPPHITLL